MWSRITAVRTSTWTAWSTSWTVEEKLIKFNIIDIDIFLFAISTRNTMASLIFFFPYMYVTFHTEWGGGVAVTFIMRNFKMIYNCNVNNWLNFIWYAFHLLKKWPNIKNVQGVSRIYNSTLFQGKLRMIQLIVSDSELNWTKIPYENLLQIQPVFFIWSSYQRKLIVTKQSKFN